MENSPFTPASASEIGSKLPETDKKDKKDSKKSKAIGSLAFEHPPATDKTEDKSPLSKLIERPEAAEPPIESNPEAGTDKAPTPELTDADTQYVVQEIAQERRAEVAAEPLSEDPEIQAAQAAAQGFYDRIVEKGLPLNEAVEETLAEISPAEQVDEWPETTDVEETESTTIPTPTPQPRPLAGVGGDNSKPPLRPPRAGTPGFNLRQLNPNGLPLGVTPAAVSLNQAPAPLPTRIEYVPYYDRSKAFGDMLVGGIVGYLIGRRRGRIKTERKLLPVQKKLEREVTSLKNTIAEKEFTVREAARQQVLEQRAVAPVAETIVSMRNPSQVPEAVILDRREHPLSAPELHKKPNFIPPPERIGKVVVAAEAARPQPTETATKMPETTNNRNTERQVENLSRNELLTLSEKVIVEGSTLRQVYETHLISERGLRRLVSEYLRGGDVVRAFRRELIEREIDFERDPKLRDTVRKNLSGAGTSKSPTLQKLLQLAGVAPVEESREALAQARAQQLQDAQQQSKRASQRKLIDVSLITVITVLLAIIVALAAHKM